MFKGKNPKHEPEATSNRIGVRLVAHWLMYGHVYLSLTGIQRFKIFQSRVWKDRELLLTFPLPLAQKRNLKVPKSEQMKINRIVRLKLLLKYHLFNEGSRQQSYDWQLVVWGFQIELEFSNFVLFLRSEDTQMSWTGQQHLGSKVLVKKIPWTWKSPKHAPPVLSTHRYLSTK